MIKAYRKTYESSRAFEVKKLVRLDRMVAEKRGLAVL